MFDLNVNSKSETLTESTLVEAVINYDVSDLSFMLQETELSIDNHIKAYQVCLKQALTESNSVIDEQVTSILETANESIGQKLINALTALKNWLMEQLKKITAALDKFYENNLNVMNKVGKKVGERLAKLDYANGPTADLYTYTYDEKLVLGNVENLIEQAYKGNGFDLSGDYSDSKEADIKAAKEAKSGDIKLEVIKKAYKGGGTLTLENFKNVIHAGIRGDGQRHTVKFAKSYLDELAKENSAAAVKKVFNDLMKAVDAEKANVKSKLGDVKKDNKEHKDAKTEQAKSAELGFYNEKIRLLNAAIDGIIAVNAIKLQAANEQVNEAKKFVVKAFTYRGNEKDKEVKKVMGESAEEYPYAFSLIETAVFAATDDDIIAGAKTW